MHGLTNETEQLARQVLELVLTRQGQDPWSLGGVATAEELVQRVGPTITPRGLGGPAALQRWVEELGPATVAADHPRYLAVIPPEAGGTFVPGGTLGNLSALHAARHAALARRGGARPARWRIATSAEAHSSVAQAARVLDVELIDVPVDANHRLTEGHLRAALDADDDGGIFAVVASAGA